MWAEHAKEGFCAWHRWDEFTPEKVEMEKTMRKHEGVNLGEQCF